jgi:SAM-dependent methyltransferase
VLDELLAAAWHRTDRYANNRVECDHGRLKARLRPMRGLKQDRSARAVIVGHAFIQNVRRGHYELAMDALAKQRVASRSTSWQRRPDSGPKSLLQHVPGRRNATAPRRSFDLVVSTLSMHHWADPTAGLAEIGRVLRPGARVLVWDFRPGVRPHPFGPRHAHVPDPAEHTRTSRLRVVDATPWRWPWRFQLTQRIELVRADRSPSLNQL